MLVWMLIVAPVIPVLIALAFVVLGVGPRLGGCIPTAMFSVLVAVEIEILLLTALILPPNQLLNQTLNLAGFVVAGAKIQSRDALSAFVAIVPARAVPAFVNKAICGSIGLGLQS